MHLMSLCREADICSANKETVRFSWNREAPIPCTQQPTAAMLSFHLRIGCPNDSIPLVILYLANSR